jgi:hypothetical protein
MFNIILYLCFNQIIVQNLKVTWTQAWIEIHRDELMTDWQLCQNGEKPFQIEPLK